MSFIAIANMASMSAARRRVLGVAVARCQFNGVKSGGGEHFALAAASSLP
jgi:hypothetical protein